MACFGYRLASDEVILSIQALMSGFSRCPVRYSAFITIT